MPLIPARCTQCGAELQVDSTAEAAICQYCQTPFIVEKAINNYNTYHQYKIENAQIHMVDESSAEYKIKNAEIYLTKHHDYKRAKELFLEASDLAPDDYRGWWGLVRIATNEFREFNLGPSIFRKVSTNKERAFSTATGDAKKEIAATWKTYHENMQKFLKPYRDAVPPLEKELNEFFEQKKVVDDEYEKQLNRIKAVEKKTFGLTFKTGIPIFIFLFGMSAFWLTWAFTEFNIIANIIETVEQLKESLRRVNNVNDFFEYPMGDIVTLALWIVPLLGGILILFSLFHYPKLLALKRKLAPVIAERDELDCKIKKIKRRINEIVSFINGDTSNKPELW